MHEALPRPSVLGRPSAFHSIRRWQKKTREKPTRKPRRPEPKMSRALFISVRFREGRYHGEPEWPPSPARLFQALVAGVASGRILAAEDRGALAWLEALTPPPISVPPMRRGQRYTNYVPNNDLDSVGGILAEPARYARPRSSGRASSMRRWRCSMLGNLRQARSTPRE